MSYDTLQVWRQGPVGWLVFDRPTVGNAADATMFEELDSAWAALDADPAVRAIVNTGNGRAFQTGLDVVQLARDPGALKEQIAPDSRCDPANDGPAQPDLEAGDRRGQRQLRRRWPSFRR